MKKKNIIVTLLIITIISSITFVVLSNKNGKSINNNGNQIAMYLLDGENGSVLSEVNTIESNYLLDETKTSCTGTTGVTGTITLENQKLSLHADGSVKCSVYFYEEKKPIVCVDGSGNEITCPATFTMGDRIAIGKGANKQTFRYLRTTRTSSNLSECGGVGITGDNGYECASKTCADSTNGVYRFLAEYNLKRTGASNSNTAIASDALQDPSDTGTTNSVQFGASNSDYSQSFLKTYLDNYATVLNTMIGKANAVTVNALSKAEAANLFGCPASSSYGTCSSIPTWAKNSCYWLGSANNTNIVWYVSTNGFLYPDYYYINNISGARAVVNIPASLF